MGVPVYNQLGNAQYRPIGRLDAQHRVIPSSFSDLAFQGAYTGTNLIYGGFARPGSSTADEVWKIFFCTYDGDSNLLSIEWPENATGNPSNDYAFAWDDRATYTYG